MSHACIFNSIHNAHFACKIIMQFIVIHSINGRTNVTLPFCLRSVQNVNEYGGGITTAIPAGMGTLPNENSTTASPFSMAINC